MALHIDKNGVGAVTPNYLTQGGVVSHPLQRLGEILHLPHAQPQAAAQNSGHPWFTGNDQTNLKIP